MILKGHTQNRSYTKSSSSPTKTIQNSNSKTNHLSAIQISPSYDPPKTTSMKKQPQKYDLSHKKTQQNPYSKPKSQASFTKSQKKSTAAKSTHQEKSSLLRLLQKSTCQKHHLWFDYNEQFPFKSQAKAQMPSDIYPDQKWEKSKEQKFQRLIQDLRNKHTARLEQKITKQNKIIEKTCTFLPNKQKVMQQEHNPQIHESLFLRFKDVQQKQRLNMQQKILQQKSLLQSYQLQNKKRFSESKQKWQKFLNTQVKKHHLDKPIHQRLDFIKDDKRDLIQQLKAKYSLEESHLKKLKLDQEQSNQLVKRLCDDYRIKKKQHQAQLEQIIKRQIRIDYPFAPIVNQTDLHRQKLSPQNKKITERNKQNFTFAPKIDEMSKIIAQKLNSKLTNHNDQFLNFPQRLHLNNELRRQKIQDIAKDIYSECTFKPEINQISKELVYVKNSSGEPLNSHKCPLPQTLIEQQKQMTFKPQINSQSKCMTSLQKQSLLINFKEKSKEKLQKLQNQKQYKEIQQCTFQPKTVSTSADWITWKQNNLKKPKLKCYPSVQATIYSDRANPQDSQVVKGLKQFMKNCQNIKRKKQSHAERLKKIFNFQQKYDERLKKQRFGLN